MKIPDPAPLLARGLALFPIPAGTKQAPPGWQHAATADPDQLAAIWTPGDNIGVACRTSWIVGVDLDQHTPEADGIEAFAALCYRLKQPWPDTFTVATPHGSHLYFRAPQTRIVPSSISRVAPGIDVRAPGRSLGGYLVGPGSRVDGRPYAVVDVDSEIAPLPPWLTDVLTFTAGRVRPGQAASR